MKFYVTVEILCFYRNDAIVTINVCTEKGIITPRIYCVNVDLPSYHLGGHYCNMIVIILRI